MRLTDYEMPAGVYSAWIPIFDGGKVIAAGWVAGHILGEDGTLTHSAHLAEEGVISGHPIFRTGAVEDAREQDIGMVVRYHGEPDPEFIYEQTHTYEDGVAMDARFTRHNAP